MILFANLCLSRDKDETLLLVCIIKNFKCQICFMDNYGEAFS